MARREKRVRRGAAILAVLTVAAFTTACASAQANTVQVGSPLTGNFNQGPFAAFRCSEYAGCVAHTPATMVQTRLPEPGANVSSPVNGTVISYRLAASDGRFAIQVIHSSPGTPHPPNWLSEFQSLSTSAPAPVSSPGVSPPIAADLAINEGDWLGIRNFSTNCNLTNVNDNCDFSDHIGALCCWPDTLGGGTFFWYSPLADGAPQVIPDYGGVGEIAMQATVRYCKVPKLKGKTPKAARKALTAADCKVGKLKKTNKVRDRKEVVSQSVKPGKAVSDTKPIKLGLSRKQGLGAA
jgi:PASTA domain